MTKENEKLQEYLEKFESLEKKLLEDIKNPQGTETKISRFKEACDLIFGFRIWFEWMREKGVVFDFDCLSKVKEKIIIVDELLVV